MSGKAALKAENDRIKRLVSFGGLNENAADRNVLSGSNFVGSIQRLLSFNTFTFFCSRPIHFLKIRILSNLNTYKYSILSFFIVDLFNKIIVLLNIYRNKL